MHKYCRVRSPPPSKESAVTQAEKGRKYPLNLPELQASFGGKLLGYRIGPFSQQKKGKVTGSYQHVLVLFIMKRV